MKPLDESFFDFLCPSSLTPAEIAWAKEIAARRKANGPEGYGMELLQATLRKLLKNRKVK